MKRKRSYSETEKREKKDEKIERMPGTKEGENKGV